MNATRIGTVALVVLILLLTVAARLRLLDLPLERDEGEYAYAGQLILQGVPPYQLAYNMKLPGTYLAYAVILAVFGQTPSGIHVGLLLVNLVTVGLVFALAKRRFGSTAALGSAAACALLLVSPSVLGLAAHATHFVILFAVAGVLLLSMAEERGRSWLYLASGTMLGLALVMKQQGGVFVLFGVLYVLLGALRGTGEERSRALMRSGLVLAGALLPLAVIALWLWQAGVFSKFWFWCFTYARTYATEVPIGVGMREFAFEFPGVLKGALLLWLSAALGVWSLWVRREQRPGAGLILSFLGASIVGVSLGLYFRAHYFILMIPALAILAGAAWQDLAERLERRSVPPAFRAALPALALLLAAGETGLQHGRALFRDTPFQVTRRMYGTNPFPEAVEVARYIAAHSKPSDTIAVLGSEPEIFFYARRRSATGHLYTYGPMEEQPYALSMQQEMIREIEASRPEYVVFVRVPSSWSVKPRSNPTLLNWTVRYTKQYDRVGMAYVHPDRSAYQWVGEPGSDVPPSSNALLVLRRRAG